MRIESFQFRDRTTSWELEETNFDAFNLLIGGSGVGKTKILEALRLIQMLAVGGKLSFAAEWALHFEQDGDSYEWRCVTSQDEPSLEKNSTAARSNQSHTIVSEILTKNKTDRIVDRNENTFTFRNDRLPQLNRSESALMLLAVESSIEPARRALESFIFADTGAEGPRKPYPHGTRVVHSRTLQKWTALAPTAQMIGEAVGLDPVTKAYLVQEFAADTWQGIKATFTEIFVTVEDLRVERRSLSNGVEQLLLNIKERGVRAWIDAESMSSGMRRSLLYLIEVQLAPPGGVFIIDEIENSLGKNCMPQLVDIFLGRAPDLQFILTSHHPYIINNIPISAWKLVQRRGSRVKVLSARDIPELQRSSHFDAFDRLLNLEEFEDGIA